MIIVNIISKQTMTDKKESQTYEIQLRIISVKMKIKFPCRMVLQMSKSPITKESSSSDQAKFIFNDNMVLKSEGDNQSFDVVANLLTQKGTKYAAGSLKLLTAEMIRSKGERIVLPLTKCLDPEAFCEIFVDNIVSLRQSQVKISRQSSKVVQSPQKPQLLSPTRKINSERFVAGETRSQVNFAPLAGLGSQQKHREVGPKSQIYKTFTKSPNSKFSTLKYVTVNNGNLGQLKSQFPIQEAISQRPSFDEGEIYRQGYHKLKQKFKQQSQLLKQQTRKKIILQASENTLKLQIMKLRVKTEEQQKNIVQKTEKIRSLSSQLSQFQKKDIDLAYVREQCISLERKNKIQQETIQGILHDNEQLKKLMVEKSKLDSQTIQGLRQEIQLANSKVDQLSYQIDAQIKAKDSIIQTKVSDIKIRNDTIQRQKNTIKELEECIEKKLLEFEKMINSERNNTQSKIDEHKVRISSVTQEKQLTEQKNNDLQNEINQLLSTINSLQFNKKTQSDEINFLNCQIKDLKVIKDKFSELSKQHKFLEEQFATVRKNLEATLSNKEVDLTHLLQQYEQGKLRNEKIKLDQDEKIKNFNTKIHEHQANQQILKNSLEKLKRNNDAITNQNSQLRQQNRRLRDDLRKAETRVITLQGQTASWSTRSERQISNLNGLLQKIRNEKSTLERELDRSQQHSQRQGQKIRQLQEKGHQWKLKERYYEERHEKQTSKSKEATQRYDSIIRDQQNMINQNSSTIENLNSENRNLRKKINDLEINLIKDRENTQRLKKELKIYQQKNLAFQHQIKQKNEQDRIKTQRIFDLEHIISERQGQINKFKELQNESIKGAEKQSKIIQILNSDVSRLNRNIEQLNLNIRQKQKNQQKLRQNLKNEREEIVKEKIKTSRIQSQFYKFKDNINDMIRIQFTRILTTPSTTNKNTERLRESQVSIAKSQKSIKSKTNLDAGALTSNLMEKLHQTKSSLWKMVQLNKLLKQEVNKLETHTENQANRHEFAKMQLHRDIQLLQDEMNNLLQDKQAENVNYDNLVIQLNMRLKDKEAQIQDLRTQIAEYDAIVKGLKTDFETNNQLNEKKVSSLRQSTSELNERIEYLNLNVACLQDKNHELQQKTIEQQNEIISTKQMLIKNQKNLIDLKQSEEKLSIHLQSLKKQLKSLQERHVDLQMQFNGQKEGKQKYIVMLQEQEKKCQKLNQFVNSLITQKQNAIKKQLEKVEENNQLENQLFELNHERQIICDENKQLKVKIDESKQEQKNLLKMIKALQKQLSEEKAKNTRNCQKIKQRQSDLQIKKQYIKDLEDKYRELREKNYKQIRQLSNQLEDKNLIAITASKQLNEKIIRVQNQSKQYWQEALSLKSENQQLTQQLYSLRDRIEDLTLQISKNKEEKNNTQEELISREFSIKERTQEIKRLQDMVLEMKFRVENLESQCQSQEKQFNHHILELTIQYNDKIQQNSKESSLRITKLQQQNRITRQSLQKTEQSLQKALLQRNTSSLENQEKLAIYEQRLKKIEAQRMAGIQAKNNDIKKINEEYRICQQRLREKESEVRKISLQLEQKKIIEDQLQAKLHHLNEQIKNKEKVHERELEVLKSKQKSINQSRQKLASNISQAEQEAKRGIAQVIKKITQLYQANQAQKIIPFFKIFENNILATFNVPSSNV